MSGTETSHPALLDEARRPGPGPAASGGQGAAEVAETFAGVPDGLPMRTPSAAGPLARSGLAVLTHFLTRGASATAATVTLTVIQVSISHSAGGVVTERE